MVQSNQNQDMAIRCAWMAYVGGHTQASIATHYGLSRAKVNRLISQAHESGYVHVYIDHSPQRLIEMSDRITQAYGLRHCEVVPVVDSEPAPFGCFSALGSAAAYYLHNRLNQGDIRTLGVSWGRSLAEMARQLPRVNRSSLAVVSVMGSLTRKSAINPFDVVHRITDITHAQGFFMPVPFMADSVADKEILVNQRSVREALDCALQAELCCVGIGAVCPSQPMFAAENGMLDAGQHAMLEDAGAVCDLMGHFLDANGRELDIELNKRVIGISIDALRKRETVAVAGGTKKIDAIQAVLRSGALTGLIIDENAASRLCDLIDEGQPIRAAEQQKTGRDAQHMEKML